MYLTSQTAFIHIPKTGGNWIQQALRTCGITPLLVGTAHSRPLPLQGPPRLTWCVARHPADWLRSLWAYLILRRQRGEVVFQDGVWLPAFGVSPGGENVKTTLYSDLQRWLGDTVDGAPLNQVLRCYLDESPGAASYILGLYAADCHAVVPFRDLVNGSFRLLSLAGEPLDSRWFTVPPVNVSQSGLQSWSDGIYFDLCKAEREAIERYCL